MRRPLRSPVAVRSNPNLQNIPVRTERGGEIQSFYTEDENHVLVSADCSRLNCVLWSIGGDRICASHLKKKRYSYRNGSPGLRRGRKRHYQRNTPRQSVNFGIIYGRGFGLADNLGISRAEAKEIIDNKKTIRQYSEMHG
jgi:DNA polymerase-1